MQDYYRILGVAPQSTFQECKKAYYRRAMECHPDRFAGRADKAEAFKALVEAFNILSDPLSRAGYDARYARRGTNHHASSLINALRQERSILDTLADDILEEMIVGNTIPRNTTLQTLMLDLERTERFCLFREGTNGFYNGDIEGATRVFQQYLVYAPLNILAHYYLGRCHIARGHYRRAARAYADAIRIGSRRQPPLTLPRIRKELDALKRTRMGLLSRFAAWWKGDGFYGEPLPPDEQLRREVSRAMHNLLKEEQRRARQLPGR